MHCDKHIPKMILESAQMLSTAHRVLDGEEYIDKTANGRSIKRWRVPLNEGVLYKATHVNHPCSVWGRQSAGNYIWLYGLFRDLSAEFEFRFGKKHATWLLLKDALKHVPVNINTREGSSDFVLAMPDSYKCDDAIQSYRNYYLGEKKDFAKWLRGREAPDWWSI